MKDFYQTEKEEPRHFDPDGKPYVEYSGVKTFYDILRLWNKDLTDKKKKIVKQEDVEGKEGKVRWVSTVFLGLDHSFFGDSKAPLIYETMVFNHKEDGEINFDDLEMQRYSSREEALAGHDEMVKAWKDK